MSVRVAPSKMNLIRFKRTLTFLKKAHDLLEDKRDILLLEVTRRVGEAAKLREELNRTLKEAYELLESTTIVMGTKDLEAAGRIPRITFELTSIKKKVMGVTTISFVLSNTQRIVSYDISRPTILLDETSEKFFQTLPLMIRVAELESTLLRLVEEVKKTQQRINALEQVLIPRYMATVSLISSVLEERDREEFVRVKKVKNLLEKKKMEG
jgi:V/A-type H+-transporting ATPase subunit D